MGGELAGRMREAIARRGPIPFYEFMTEALYAAEGGYYAARSARIGRHGDFFTSVAVGPLFGEILAHGLMQWLRGDGSSESGMQEGPWEVVEAGAHDGQLAYDVLEALWRDAPDMASQVRYRILEPSKSRRGWQADTLQAFEGQIEWWEGWQETPKEGIRGFILANELLDAMPVRALAWDASRKEWLEWGVDWEGQADRFVWTRLPFRPEEMEEPIRRMLTVSSELAEWLPEGFTIEVSPDAVAWWREAVQSLRQGRLVVLDYGLAETEVFAPERLRGTLRAYRGHEQAEDILTDPGSQDITAHVHFDLIRAVGEESGLVTEMWKEQGRILTEMALNAWRRGDMTAGWTRKRARQFHTLTHPAYLGKNFQGLVQKRGI